MMNVKINLKDGFHIVEEVDKDTMEYQAIIGNITSAYTLYRVIQSNFYERDTYLLGNNTGDFNIITYSGKEAFIITCDDIAGSVVFRDN